MGEQARKSMGELALRFICCAVAQARKRYPSPHLTPHHLQLAGELGPEVIRAGELIPYQLQHLGELALHLIQQYDKAVLPDLGVGRLASRP